MERASIVLVLALAMSSSGCCWFRKTAPAPTPTPVAVCQPMPVCPNVCDPCAPQGVSFGTAGFGGPSFVPAQ